MTAPGDQHPAVGSADTPTISAVIATRNRPASLDRTLRALARQERLPDEVIVVDASDEPTDEEALRRAHGALTLVCLRSSPGVCAQRNLGVRRASGSHVLIIDDDVEPPPEYLAGLTDHLARHPSVGAVSGFVSEPEGDGSFAEGFAVPSFRWLLFAFVFQLTVWGDVAAARAGRVAAAPLAVLARWYRRRGNGWSLAGWPLVTQVRGPVVRTAIYGLGAALVRRDWLLASPYDERLGPHGIGDNYGVAVGFPEEPPAVEVLTELRVRHHRAAENRLAAAEAYYRRVLALDYFLRTSSRFGRLNTVFLAWSLAGNALLFTVRRRPEHLRRTLRALLLVASGRSPLLAPPERAAGARAPAGRVP